MIQVVRCLEADGGTIEIDNPSPDLKPPRHVRFGERIFAMGLETPADYSVLIYREVPWSGKKR